MNLKQQLIKWMNTWQKASYSEGIAIAVSLDTSNHVIRSLLGNDSINNRKILLTKFGDALRSGILDKNQSVPGVSTAAADDSQRPATVAKVIRENPPITGGNTPNTHNTPGKIPQVALLKVEQDNLVSLLVSNHSKLKEATTDIERKYLIAEQKEIQKNRAEIAKNIRLVQQGQPIEVAAAVSTEKEDIFTIPESAVEIYDKKRRHTKARSKAAADMRKWANNPEKLASASQRWNDYDQAFKVLDNAYKKIKKGTRSTQ